MAFEVTVYLKSIILEIYGVFPTKLCLEFHEVILKLIWMRPGNNSGQWNNQSKVNPSLLKLKTKNEK
jgi:hypothetical protein